MHYCKILAFESFLRKLLGNFGKYNRFLSFYFRAIYNTSKVQKIVKIAILALFWAINRSQNKNSKINWEHLICIPKSYLHAGFKSRFFYILAKTLYFCLFFTSIFAPTANLQMSIKSELTRLKQTNEHFLKPGKIALYDLCKNEGKRRDVIYSFDQEFDKNKIQNTTPHSPLDSFILFSLY